MTMLKVIEMLAQSNNSWEDAAQQAVKEASKTARNIKSIYIHDMEATVENEDCELPDQREDFLRAGSRLARPVHGASSADRR